MAKEQDFTLEEARTAIWGLAAEIGAHAYASASLVAPGSYRKGACSISYYPNGVTGKEYFSVEADTWRECVDGARKLWAERSEQHTVTLIRRMALKIIEITADIGECTDRALRADFDAVAVTKHAAAAAEQANALAAGGPFSVVETTSANDLAA